MGEEDGKERSLAGKAPSRAGGRGGGKRPFGPAAAVSRGYETPRALPKAPPLDGALALQPESEAPPSQAAQTRLQSRERAQRELAAEIQAGPGRVSDNEASYGASCLSLEIQGRGPLSVCGVFFSGMPE